jgi:hypothetical protein
MPLPLLVLSVLAASLLAGCVVVAPRAAVKPMAFEHPQELVRGTGTASNYWVLADRRIFAVMAFLNAVGYDEEASNAQMTPLRLEVRKKVASRLTDHPEKLQEWRRYYQARRRGSWQYANFALSLNEDFPFERIRPNQELTYKATAWDLRGLPEILNDFWKTVELEQIWEESRPSYAAELSRYSPALMADEMEQLWRYLRMPRRDNWTVIHIPNPLQKQFTASANQFGEFFYSIDGPGSNAGGLNRHEYLHTFVNDLVRRCYPGQASKLKGYFSAGKHKPISATVQKPEDWVSECLVFALDNRIWAQQVSSRQDDSEMRARVEALTRDGLFLLQPLYNALGDFEKSELPFDRYLPILLTSIPEYKARPAIR